MKKISQQIIINGIGGQGILFITKLLAQAAINKGLSVYTSETHGMAQRGGNVISHLKIGEFISPLIRPKAADGMIALQKEGVDLYKHFLKNNGWIFLNSSNPDDKIDNFKTTAVNADKLALQINNPLSLNLIMLGNSLKSLFCFKEDMDNVLLKRFSSSEKILKAVMLALDTGFNA